MLKGAAKTAYMREYMRRRRAGAKLAQPTSVAKADAPLEDDENAVYELNWRNPKILRELYAEYLCELARSPQDDPDYPPAHDVGGVTINSRALGEEAARLHLEIGQRMSVVAQYGGDLYPTPYAAFGFGAEGHGLIGPALWKLERRLEEDEGDET